MCLFIFLSFGVSELYLSLAYFYVQKCRLSDRLGPSQFQLKFLQLVGCVSIIINYFINKSIALSSFGFIIFYRNNQSYLDKVYCINFILSLIIMILTIIVYKRTNRNPYKILIV